MADFPKTGHISRCVSISYTQINIVQGGGVASHPIHPPP